MCDKVFFLDMYDHLSGKTYWFRGSHPINSRVNDEARME